MGRPKISKDLDEQGFRSFYYLKEELVVFCREEGIQTTGSKEEVTNRVAHYLKTGEKLRAQVKPKRQVPSKAERKITPESIIESDFICSESHRAFYKEHVGESFSFKVAFQKWLKENAGKTYQESIEVYEQLINEAKTKTTTIDRQFEYNTYIRDFFADNTGKTLREAILCWKTKKALPGHNKYEKEDLAALRK